MIEVELTEDLLGARERLGVSSGEVARIMTEAIISDGCRTTEQQLFVIAMHGCLLEELPERDQKVYKTVEERFTGIAGMLIAEVGGGNDDWQPAGTKATIHRMGYVPKKRPNPLRYTVIPEAQQTFYKGHIGVEVKGVCDWREDGTEPGLIDLVRVTKENSKGNVIVADRSYHVRVGKEELQVDRHVNLQGHGIFERLNLSWAQRQYPSYVA